METTQYYFRDSKGLITDEFLIPILDKQLRILRPKRILDVGCGNGSIARFFIEKGYDVYGIDASVKGIEFARIYHAERFHVQDLNDDGLPLAIKDKSFDLIISTEVIEHVYSPLKFIKYCHNNLVSSGHIILSTPYHGYLKNLALALSGKMDHHFTALWEGGHIKFWSKSTLTQLLESHGFRVRDFNGAGRFPYLWKSMVLTAQKQS
jgi:2-polyprenyl-6-hydroxyphenyl methylase/3-demethylubiquinone-9 3-methyltransferase